MTEPAATRRRLLREASAARGYLIGAVLLGLVVTGLILAQAGLLATALAGAGRDSGLTALTGPVTLLLAVLAARSAALSGGEVLALRAAARVKYQLRSRLIRHALDLGPAWLDSNRAGELTVLTTSGLDGLDPYFARYLPQLVLAVAVPAAVLATVTAADWLSGVIIALTLPLIPVFAVLAGAHAKARSARQWRLLARLGGHFLDVVQGLPTLKVFGRAKAQERVIAEVTVLLLTPEAYLPLRGAAAQFHASADGTAAAASAFDVLDLPAPGTRLPGRPRSRVPAGPAPASSPGTPDLRAEDITLNAVTVVYPGREAPALNQVSLTIRPGDKIMLTGRNGAGKTTPLSLLLRFTEPTGGSVLAGGADLAVVPADLWRAQIAWLPQQPWLFPWSVAENIALGRPLASRAEIERAADLAGAAAFVDALPCGYDTVLDERGLRLSAGQRQKIALARLFLRDAPLVLLDEPTAHLDPVSTAEINAAISALAVGRTVIAVTHRSGVVLSAGPGGRCRTLDVSGGTITEHGAALERRTTGHETAGRGTTGTTSADAEPGTTGGATSEDAETGTAASRMAGRSEAEAAGSRPSQPPTPVPVAAPVPRR
jgi:ATP-binding cassette subfamily C protein CydD